MSVTGLLPSFRRGRPLAWFSHRRKPPRKALALSPARQPGGNLSSWWTLPPPRTTSSGSSAATRRLTTSSTSRRHCVRPCCLQRGHSHVPLEGCVPVRQVTQLHRLHDAVDDHGGAQTGAEPEKQHLAALIAAQRLHRRVVHHLDRASERLPVVESDPARAEVTRLRQPDDREAPGRESRSRPRRTSSPRRRS